VNDWGKVGVIAAELIDTLAEQYEGEDVKIGVVAVVVEITSDEEAWTSVQYRCNDARRWIQVGLFDAASRAVQDSSEERE
jgi:hypothetical protein